MSGGVKPGNTQRMHCRCGRNDDVIEATVRCAVEGPLAWLMSPSARSYRRNAMQCERACISRTDEVSIAVTSEQFVADVNQSITLRVARTLEGAGGTLDVSQLQPGKMLRSRLAGRFVEAGVADDLLTVRDLCAATEIVHTASLCHDDLVDGADTRRGQCSLWRATSPSAAVLIGDLLLCEATELLRTIAGGRFLGDFLAKVTEMVQAEAQQELVFRGTCVDEETCLRLARGKTGPLFAFAAMVCGGDDPARCAALEEAGYRIGTAYQLGDDLTDAVGDERVAGKTLGADEARGKYTLAHIGAAGPDATREKIRDLCILAQECLATYPVLATQLRQFLRHDLRPALDRHPDIHVELGI